MKTYTLTSLNKKIEELEEKVNNLLNKKDKYHSSILSCLLSMTPEKRINYMDLFNRPDGFQLKDFWFNLKIKEDGSYSINSILNTEELNFVLHDDISSIYYVNVDCIPLKKEFIDCLESISFRGNLAIIKDVINKDPNVFKSIVKHITLNALNGMNHLLIKNDSRAVYPSISNRVLFVKA